MGTAAAVSSPMKTATVSATTPVKVEAAVGAGARVDAVITAAMVVPGPVVAAGAGTAAVGDTVPAAAAEIVPAANL